MTRVAVFFKDEDDVDGEPVGPVTVVDLDGRDADPNVDPDSLGIPYGYEPDWLTKLGWLPRSEALRVASSHGVTLEES